MDDTFAICGSELDCDHCKGQLILLHTALQFTVEKEQNNSLNFLDVLVEEDGTGFLTSVYRKEMVNGQCIHWNSFSPKTRVLSLITTLVYRALMICSKTTWGPDLDKIKQLLIESTSLHQSKTSQLCSRKNMWSREVPDLPEIALDC